MNAICLQVFVTAAHRHQGRLTYEWLLDTAKASGIAGGTALQAIAGYGRHGRHDAGFFELAGELPVIVQCMAEPAAIETFLTRIREAGLALVYVKLPAELGTT